MNARRARASLLTSELKCDFPTMLYVIELVDHLVCFLYLHDAVHQVDDRSDFSLLRQDVALFGVLPLQLLKQQKNVHGLEPVAV